MNLKEKLKQFINVTDDDYIDSAESDYTDDFDFEPAKASVPETKPQSTRLKADKASSNSNNNVVNINSSKAASQPRPHVVF